MVESILRSGAGSAQALGTLKVFARLLSLRLLAPPLFRHPVPGCTRSGMPIFPLLPVASEVDNYPHSPHPATLPSHPPLSQAPLPTSHAYYNALPSGSLLGIALMPTTQTN